ncbi:hypothetical protein LWI29_024695 [Acer saccharum]|uniref:BRCT domain-containing protein n=1 Tax=Acer saccharum TaxID=4024 RepID=A0AA39S4E7_ACESA|nr:hypothetical protein LWI29_024695 [Acer saccharum]
MEEALSGVKKGILTFSSEWLMNCIMKQELDLETPNLQSHCFSWEKIIPPSVVIRPNSANFPLEFLN